MSEEQLEVVKVSPSTALDRALLKETKKHQRKNSHSNPHAQDNDHLNINTSTTSTSAKDVLESQGQELLWVEDDENVSRTKDKDSNTATDTHTDTDTTNANDYNKKKVLGLLGSFRNGKSMSQQRRSQGKHKNPKPKETNARVVLLTDPGPSQQDAAPAPAATTTTTTTTTTTNASNDRLHQAVTKAQEARDLLDQALVPLHSPIERNVMLRKAFSTAVEARKLVDPDVSVENKKNAKHRKAYHELEQTKSLGEEEALEASRIISIMAGQQHVLDESEEAKSKRRQRKKRLGAASDVDPCSERKSLPFDTLLRLANEHAEAARRYLESMLPFFQDQVESGGDICRPHSNHNATNNRVSTVVPRIPDVEYDRAERGPGNHMPEELQAAIPNGVIDEETKRRAAERQAALARLAPQNNTVPSLGFDNTFQNGDTISTLGFDNTFQNEDSLTINSLNAFLDAPMSGTAENSLGRAGPDKTNNGGAAAVAPDVDDQFGAPIISIGPAIENEPSTGKQREPKFALFRRNNKSTKGQQKKGTTERVDRFMPTTVTPVCDDELDAIDPEIRQQLVHIQDIERVTGDRLQAAMQKTQAAAKANIALARRDRGGDLGQAGINDPATRGVFYRDPTTEPPQFVDAPIIPPGILTQKSWEDLADGASLASVTSLPEQITENEVPVIVPQRASSFAHRKRFGLFRSITYRTLRRPRATGASQPKKRPEKESKDVDEYASPASWQEVVARGATAATSGEDPADDHVYNVTVLNGNEDDNSSPTATYGERDRYAVLLDDLECQGIVDNERVPNEGLNSHVSNLAPKGIRSAFSWDAGKHSQNASGAKPSYVEVDGEDEAKLVLANKEEVLQSIQAPVRVQPTEDIKTIRSMINDAEISPSASFVEQMAEAKDVSAKHRAAAATTTPSPGRKKGIYGRWRSRPAQI